LDPFEHDEDDSDDKDIPPQPAVVQTTDVKVLDFLCFKLVINNDLSNCSLLACIPMNFEVILMGFALHHLV